MSVRLRFRPICSPDANSWAWNLPASSSLRAALLRNQARAGGGSGPPPPSPATSSRSPASRPRAWLARRSASLASSRYASSGTGTIPPLFVGLGPVITARPSFRHGSSSIVVAVGRSCRSKELALWEFILNCFQSLLNTGSSASFMAGPSSAMSAGGRAPMPRRRPPPSPCRCGGGSASAPNPRAARAGRPGGAGRNYSTSRAAFPLSAAKARLR